ncbi:hypothetical protein Tco_1433921 [Tanacetum coccineum]
MDKEDSKLVNIMDDLFRIGDENLKRMEQDIDQDSICKQDDDLDDDQEEGGDDRDIFYIIHVTPPDENYVAPAIKSILDYLLEEFGEEILNVTMVDEGAECSPTKDLEELERLLAKDPQSHYTKIRGYNSEETKLEVTSTRNYVVYAFGISFSCIYTGNAHDESPVMVDVARGSRLETLLRA